MKTLANVFVVLVFFSFSGPAQSQAQAPVILKTYKGHFLLFMKEGVPVVKPMEELEIFDWSDGAPDDPEEPTDPSDPLAAKVQAWASEIADPVNAQRYKWVFKTVRDGVSDESIPVGKALEVIRLSADLVLTDSWRPFRAKLSQENDALIRAGKLRSREQVMNYCAKIYNGLAASASNTELTEGQVIAVVAIVHQSIDEVTR